MRITARSAALLAGFILLLGPAGCRHDDSLEPNDTYETATPLTIGAEVLATAMQGNPDVFSAEAPMGRTLVFRLRSLGHEDCPEFTLLGPKETVVYEDHEGFCTDPWKAKTKAEGVSASGGRRTGYEFRIAVKETGKYFLRIRERKQADNPFAYSWDYGLTASIE